MGTEENLYGSSLHGEGCLQILVQDSTIRGDNKKYEIKIKNETKKKEW
jgi:hypothetical protein